MRVRFQYADWTVWEGLPEDAHLSPNPEPPEGGIIRMIAITDDDREIRFTYNDFYYMYETEDGTGWLFGAESPRRNFIFSKDGGNPTVRPVPFELPKRAIIRKGVTVSQEEAVKFGLIKSVDAKRLHDKSPVIIQLV